MAKKSSDAPELETFKAALLAAVALRDPASIETMCKGSPALAREALAANPWFDETLSKTKDYSTIHLWHPGDDSHLFFGLDDPYLSFRQSIDILAANGYAPGPKVIKLWLQNLLSNPSNAATILWMLDRGFLAPESALAASRGIYRTDGILLTIAALAEPEALSLLSRLRDAGFCSGPAALCGPTDLAAFDRFALAQSLLDHGMLLGHSGFGLSQNMEPSFGLPPIHAFCQHFDFGGYDTHGQSRTGHSALKDPKLVERFGAGLARLAHWGARVQPESNSSQCFAWLFRYRQDMAMLEGPGAALRALGADPNDGAALARQLAVDFRNAIGRSHIYGIKPLEALDWAVSIGFEPAAHSGIFIQLLCGYLQEAQTRSALALLKPYGIVPSKVARIGPSPIAHCIEWGHGELAFKLADEGVPLDYVDEHGECALHHLAHKTSKPSIALLSKFLERPALAALLAQASTETHRAGETPLHQACGALNAQAIAMFLKLGADANARDAKGWTPIRHLLRKFSDKHSSKTEPALRMLLNAGAAASIPDNEGRTPAQSAAKRAPLGALGLLLGLRPEDLASDSSAARAAKQKIEARGAHGQSLSERAQFTAASAPANDAPAAKPKARSL
jgi:hypothetical protein